MKVEQLMDVLIWEIYDDNVTDRMIIIMREGELEFYSPIQEGYEWPKKKEKEK